MRSSLFWGVTQRRLVVKTRFGTTYRSHLQAVQEERHSSWTTWPLKMGPTVCPETSVDYQSLLRNVQKQLKISSTTCADRRITDTYSTHNCETLLRSEVCQLQYFRLRTAIPSKNWSHFSRREGWSLNQRHSPPRGLGKYRVFDFTYNTRSYLRTGIKDILYKSCKWPEN